MYHFIVNPHARSGLGQKVWTDLENVLKNKKIEYQVFFTKYQKHATSIANEITSDPPQNTIWFRQWRKLHGQQVHQLLQGSNLLKIHTT